LRRINLLAKIDFVEIVAKSLPHGVEQLSMKLYRLPLSILGDRRESSGLGRRSSAMES
jgi:hypothetical protein